MSLALNVKVLVQAVPNVIFMNTFPTRFANPVMTVANPVRNLLPTVSLVIKPPKNFFSISVLMLVHSTKATLRYRTPNRIIAKLVILPARLVLTVCPLSVDPAVLASSILLKRVQRRVSVYLVRANAKLAVNKPINAPLV